MGRWDHAEPLTSGGGTSGGGGSTGGGSTGGVTGGGICIPIPLVITCP